MKKTEIRKIRNLWTVSETFGFGSEYQTKNIVTEFCQLKV